MEPGIDDERLARVFGDVLAVDEHARARAADANPQRAETILAATRDGRLSPNDFAYVRAGFFPGAAKAYQEMLAGLGKPDSVAM